MEIGSEFWETEIVKDLSINIPYAYNYFLTGRTALDFLIKEIKNNNKINKVYMPNYCCYSMIQPFVENGIEIEFYEVYFKDSTYNYNVNLDTSCELIFLMSYFGYSNESVKFIAAEFKKRNKIILEDSTHSWFSDEIFLDYSDYIFASLRKWTSLAGGAIAFKKNGDFLYNSKLKINEKYLSLRKKAAALKKEYIESKFGEKKLFLNIFNEAEETLNSDYKNYTLPVEIQNTIKHLDIEKIKYKRRENAEYLISELNKIPLIETLQLNNGDTPLFVPIIITNGKRNELRKYLIEKKIYCPIHWPLSSHHQINNKFLYENSISLVCDQRYSLNQMKKIIECIKVFLED